MAIKRWFLIRIDRRKFNGDKIINVFDCRPRFRAWLLTKWANVSGRDFFYITELREERRKDIGGIYWPMCRTRRSDPE